MNIEWATYSPEFIAISGLIGIGLLVALMYVNMRCLRDDESFEKKRLEHIKNYLEHEKFWDKVVTDRDETQELLKLILEYTKSYNATLIQHISEINRTPSPPLPVEKYVNAANSDTTPTKEPASEARKSYEKPSLGQLDQFLHLVNEAVESEDMDRLWDSQFEIIRVGATNSMERYKDPSVEPLFGRADNGDYYAVRLDDLDKNEYAMVPRVNLVFQESNFGPGAMGIVFRCLNYDSDYRYYKFTVLDAAIFEVTDDDIWKLKTPGRLELRQGRSSD